MKAIIYPIALLSLPLFVLLHAWVAPHTKVEESFNIQAVHDILTAGIPTQNVSSTFQAKYDHMTFPGAVPRTFVGALLLAELSRPVTWWNSTVDKQLLVRAILGLLNSLALMFFASRVRSVFGAVTAIWYIIIQATQFHVIFYASRLLPNMFAFAISTCSLGLLLPQPLARSQALRRYKSALFLLTVAGVVFRSELALLLGTHVVTLYSLRQVSLLKDLVPVGIMGVLVGLALSIPIDTFLWQSSTPLWPELSAFLSNIFPPEGNEGASAWGTSPWYWYFTSALPRLLMNPLVILLIIAALVLPATRAASAAILLPNMLYIALYSILPHKETRFIMYTIPTFNLTAALSATYVWNHRTKSAVFGLFTLALVTSSILTAIVSHALLLPVSALNYPGGYALRSLHTIADQSQSVIKVHLDNLSTQTGVTRFQQKLHPIQSADTHWIYDKSEDEDVKLTPDFWDQFDWVIAEEPRRVIGAWEIVDTIKGLGGARILRPGIDRSPDSTSAVISQTYGNTLSALWSRFVEMWREVGVTKGWWAEVYLSDKLYILRKSKGVDV